MHSLGQVRVKYYKRNVGWTMKSRYRFFCFTLTFVLVLCTAAQVSGSTGTDEKKAVSSIVQMIPAAVDMKETDGPGNLYALSAVLMDGDSGRVLYEKEGYTARPNASTTKVMTCILALEKGSGDDYVMVSENAASQPEVKLNLKEGEQYYLEDLLYSLMLKSHNDTAVAIAEHIGGSVEGFAKMMNAKAKEIGCTNTHFVTPNGLDSADAGGIHQTTARDLALIMSYAVKNKAFLHITQTRDYSFSDITGKRQFSVHNANAFLDMTPDAISGKTGFTGNAGYCYVAACENEERKFIISLLGCGWPNNKTYKWKDAMKLLEYGKANFHKETYWQEPEIPAIPVKDGTDESSGKESGKENHACMITCHIAVSHTLGIHKTLISFTEFLNLTLLISKRFYHTDSGKTVLDLAVDLAHAHTVFLKCTFHLFIINQCIDQHNNYNCKTQQRHLRLYIHKNDQCSEQLDH